ncbi:MAG TPA: acetylglutamate kinase, partial [Myxococcaceae bacterium]|nr:acetylglutamate kinase [Myxococcaceae bacterium]
VKAAIFGADPNWGRILATVGARAGSQGYALEPARSQVSIQGLVVYDHKPVLEDRTVLRRKMRESEVRVAVALGQGDSEATAWGCDLSYDYVKINADYTSLIVQTASGGVAKDDRLSHYSPAFKVNLLVESLKYISRFKGKRCVIKYGGAAMTKESLKRSFCSDVLLLRSVGLVPIVVHGGGPEMTRTLERLGGTPEFVDGIRVTPASDLKVVEMVLTGAINTELVTLLNQSGPHAVGVSGKDGALLRAKKLIRQDGRDLGQVGEITQVNARFLEMLLDQGYVPVISPVGLGDNGESFNIDGDTVAAEVAAAVGASKLIILSNVAGILDNESMLSELKTSEVRERLISGAITGGMAVKARAILRALDFGVSQAHVIDGRTPHSVIAELFTDNGVGTLVTPS